MTNFSYLLLSIVLDPQLFETVSSNPSHFPLFSTNYQSTFGQVTAAYCRPSNLLLSQATIPSVIHFTSLAIPSSLGKIILLLCNSGSGSSLPFICAYSTLRQGLGFI